MNAQQTNSSVGGASMVALLMPNMAMVNDADSSYATTELQYLSEVVPDLTFIYYAGGTINRFNSFVNNPGQDIFSLSTGLAAATSAGPVTMRIRKSKFHFDMASARETLVISYAFQFHVASSIRAVAQIGLHPIGALIKCFNI